MKSTAFIRETLIDILRTEIIDKAEEEGLPFYSAAPRVLISWLGYQSEGEDRVTFIDAKDSGIDAWYLADSSTSPETGIEIFQVKTHELTSDGLLCLDPFDNEGVNDLARAKSLLLSDISQHSVSNEKIRDLLTNWSYTIRNWKLRETPSEILVTLNLIILGEKLTPQALDEFKRLGTSNNDPVHLDNVSVKFNTVLYTIDNIINSRWREENRVWRDSSGQKHTSIKLEPIKEIDYISDNKNAVFYCSTIDLVNAYQLLGYQLFEPNVRANIKSSRVNRAIRDSVKKAQSRKDFRFLNNGVTITCESYEKPRGGRKWFEVHYPGVINGLQTVVALHTAYNELSDRDKEDFENSCSVLVRVLNKNAVHDVTDVVRATNNQNPMKPRNLVSNSPEQIIFTRIFADQLGWFYQAKEGAWDAFEKDWKRWRPRLNKSPRDFQPPKSSKKNRIRKVDNHELAQSWLSFIGFSNTAAEAKRALFEKKYYDLIFKKRTNKHGFDYEYNQEKAFNGAEDNAPNASLMLTAHLSYLFLKSAVPTPQQNRKDTCERLKINMDDYSTVELDNKLSDDETFRRNQILRYMPFLFTEFVGFILFRCFGENIHNYGNEILSNHSFASMRDDINPSLIMQKINDKSFKENDLLVVLWLMFYDKIQDLIMSDWGQGYSKANRKPRYVLSKESRNKLYKEIQDLDSFMKKRQLTKFWAIGVKENQGIFEFITDCLGKA